MNEENNTFTEELDHKGNLVRRIYVLVDFYGGQAVFIFYGEDSGARHWYYTAIRNIDQELQKAVDVGNHGLIVAWLKDNFDDMYHKRVTFEKGPGIRKLFGRGKSKYQDEEY